MALAALHKKAATLPLPLPLSKARVMTIVDVAKRQAATLTLQCHPWPQVRLYAPIVPHLGGIPMDVGV